jgi:hypothetical protein
MSEKICKTVSDYDWYSQYRRHLHSTGLAILGAHAYKGVVPLTINTLTLHKIKFTR